MIKPEENIFSGQGAIESLHHYFASCNASKKMVFILVDENTRKYCLPFLIPQSESDRYNLIIIEIHSGEKYKSLDTVAEIWKNLTTAGADRKSVLVNLGGGVLCDLGGFAASCYNRGIETIHIPTTLLAMSDASIGGKTGFDFMSYKNHIGTFHRPERVYIFTEFLKTLEARQIKAAMAEIIKYGFISNPEIPGKLKNQDLTTFSFDALIQICINAKIEITNSDPDEQGLRKILNFGHTVGHAIESFALSHEIDILHGEAVAVGLLCELWLSIKHRNLNINILNDYIRFYNEHFAHLTFVFENADEILERMMMDKKNSSGLLKFVLISRLGEPMWDVIVNRESVIESLVFYNALKV